MERKSAFISQVPGGDFDQREIDDIGEQALSFAEVKALATGDRRIMEKAGVDADVARLGRLERTWHNDQRRLRLLLDNARYQAQIATERADRLTDVTARVTDTRGDRFTMTIDGRLHTKRRQAGEHLGDLLARQLASTPPEATGKPHPIAQLGGFDIHAQAITVIEDELRILIPPPRTSRACADTTGRPPTPSVWSTASNIASTASRKPSPTYAAGPPTQRRGRPSPSPARHTVGARRRAHPAPAPPARTHDAVTQTDTPSPDTAGPEPTGTPAASL